MSSSIPVAIEAQSASDAPSVWKWYRPSLTDIFFFFVICWLFLAGSDNWQALLRDGDTGMHLRTGDWIVEHGQVPRLDIFSYTQTGAAWYAFQWGSGVMYSWLNTFFGLKGVVLLAGVTICLWIAILNEAMLRIGVHGLLACILALAAGNAGSLHYHARPHLFTMFFLAISVWIVERDRQQQSMRIWWLVPMAAVWANFHSGFVILPMYLAIVAVGGALQQQISPHGEPPIKRYLYLTGACGLATLANPYGIALHLHILNFLSGPVATKFIDEYQSPQFRSEPAYWFLVLLFGAISVAGIQLYRKRVVDAVTILAFCGLSLISARNIPLFLTVAVPLAARAISEIWSAAAALVDRKSPTVVLYRTGVEFAAKFTGFTLWTGICILLVATLCPASFWPVNFDPKYFPIKLFERNGALLGKEKVFTTDQWGDYLIYMYKGQQHVFLDGRSDFYRPEVVRNYMAIAGGQPRWRQLLNEYGINAVLIEPESPLHSLLLQDPEWSLSDSDQLAVLLLRKFGQAR